MVNDTGHSGPAIILIISTLAYHVSQKSIPAGVHPLVSAACTFLIALAASLALLPLFTDIHGIKASVGQLNWAGIASGLAITGITAGHVLYYRTGWTLSTGTLFSYGTVCVFLIPIGLLFFNERITACNAAGIALSLAGLYLMER